MEREINHNNKKFKHVGNTGNLLIYAYEDLRILADVAGNIIYEYSITSDIRLSGEKNKNSNKPRQFKGEEK